MSRFGKPHFRFLAALIGVVLLAEMALRTLTPLPMTDFADATWDPHLLYRVPKILGANADGFRERSDAEAATIAAIGDSFTFGLGVEASASWPEKVEVLSGQSVYNYSAPSYNIYQYYFLAMQALDSGVDEIIIGFYPSNDLRLQVCQVLELDYWRDFLEAEGLDPAGCAEPGCAEPGCAEPGCAEPGCTEPEKNYEDFKKAEGAGLAYSLTHWGVENSALFCLLYAATDKVWGALPYDKSQFVFARGIPFAKSRMKYRLYQTDWESELVQASYRNSQQLFLKMRDQAADHGARLRVLLIPSKFQVARDVLREEGAEVPELLNASGASVQRLEDAYLEFFQASGIPALSASERLEDLYRRSMHEGDSLYPRDDEHLREEGYAALAEVAMELRAQAGGPDGGLE